MKQCPKYESCTAPICPLDNQWETRTHIKNEPICFYIRQHAKSQPLGIQLDNTLLNSILDKHASIKRGYERAAQTPSRIDLKGIRSVGSDCLG